MPPSSDARPLYFFKGDRQALSTARFCRVGQLATADTCTLRYYNVYYYFILFYFLYTPGSIDPRG